ncbi:gamma-glutamylcyclotransferase [Caldimonas sp. KR1-144]|uniref:gamma-glutamylcyclotransferase n=1 Tax=Caldimonas sp. KR1-144 TaxID=3400911 RepID=UPI003BFAFB1F
MGLDVEAPPATVAGVPVLRDPQALLEATLQGWSPQEDLWVFGYASLIWRPEFEAVERRSATVHGFHRAFRMRSRVNRGTPDKPGLVFALLPGGSCRGVVYRIAQAGAREQLDRLWAREMPTGVYDPRWLRCQTPGGTVRALAFTLSRRSPAHVGMIDDAQLLAILRNAKGRYGSTLEYLVHTHRSLRAHGIRDAAVERHVALALRNGLVES